VEVTDIGLGRVRSSQFGLRGGCDGQRPDHRLALRIFEQSGAKRSFLDHSNAHIFFTTFAVFVGIDLGGISVFVIARDAERAAQFFGQRRLAEQAGVFEPVEVGGPTVPEALSGRCATTMRAVCAAANDYGEADQHPSPGFKFRVQHVPPARVARADHGRRASRNRAAIICPRCDR
jgi:hypothetical protein